MRLVRVEGYVMGFSTAARLPAEGVVVVVVAAVSKGRWRTRGAMLADRGIAPTDSRDGGGVGAVMVAQSLIQDIVRKSHCGQLSPRLPGMVVAVLLRTDNTSLSFT